MLCLMKVTQEPCSTSEPSVVTFSSFGGGKKREREREADRDLDGASERLSSSLKIRQRNIFEGK